jgi:hypothetical protein
MQDGEAIKSRQERNRWPRDEEDISTSVLLDMLAKKLEDVVFGTEEAA